MAKVITVSWHFPAYHLRAGQPTHFVEKIHVGLLMHMLPIWTDNIPICLMEHQSKRIFNPKYHTIRAGKRWKTGDMASIRVWSGNPYRSPQIAICKDIPVYVKDIEIRAWDDIVIDGVPTDCDAVLPVLAQNDGLTVGDLKAWFNKLPFSGQIICFTDKKIPY